MLVILIAALAIYSAIEGDLARTLRFLFVLDAKHLTPQVALDALGLGFFSIGVGLCILITYAAYAGPHIDLQQVAIFTIVSDTAISFMAGFAVFPLVFAENLDPSGGPGLVFTTLAIAFARMPFGAIAAMAFFGLLTVAALGSAISFLELAVAPLRNALGWSRVYASLACGLACWAVGLVSVFSFNLWAGWFPLAIDSVVCACDTVRPDRPFDVERPAARLRLRAGDFRRLDHSRAGAGRGAGRACAVPGSRSCAGCCAIRSPSGSSRRRQPFF